MPRCRWSARTPTSTRSSPSPSARCSWAGRDCVARRLPLRARRLPGVPDAVVLQEAGPPDEEPAGLDPGDHLRQHLLDALVAADLLAKGLALVGVPDRRIEAGLGEPDVP